MTWDDNAVFRTCRDLQHSWKPRTARSVKGGFEREMTCTRCKAIKVQRLDRYGYIVGSSMSYPEGYVRTGEGRMTQTDRASLRLRNTEG